LYLETVYFRGQVGEITWLLFPSVYLLIIGNLKITQAYEHRETTTVSVQCTILYQVTQFTSSSISSA